MKAHVDADLCIGCGSCADVSEVFEIVDDVSTVKIDPVPENEIDFVRSAAENCPVEAISIEE